MSEDFPVRVEQRGGVAIWTIDRADRANALSRATLLAFGKLAREAAANPSIRAIVVTGAGDKAFCAGADLKERQGMSENDVRVQVGLYRTRAGTARPVAQARRRSTSTAPRSAAGSSSRSAAICASRRRTPSSVFRRRRSASSPAPAARSVCRASWARRAPRR